MADQFSRVFRTGIVEQITDTSHTVTPLYRITGKIVERKHDASDEGDAGAHAREQRQYSQVPAPRPELWDMVIEAVEQFNNHQDLRRSPFAVRIWAQNAGFRVQLIQEDTGALIKQTRLIPFRDLSSADLNDIINSLVRERGVVIDLVR